MPTKKAPVTNVVSALTARTQFGQIMKRAAQKNERFLVGRRGELKIVILSLKDYIDTFAPPPDELLAMQATAQRTGASKLTARQISAEIAATRRDLRNQTTAPSSSRSR